MSGNNSKKNNSKKKIVSDKKTASVGKNDNRMLEITTTQTGAFKQVIERIQSVLSETSIIFIPPDDIEDDNIDEEYESDEESISVKSKKNKKNKSEDESEEDVKSKTKKSVSKSTKKTKKNESDSESEEEIKSKTKKPASKKSTKKNNKSKSTSDDSDDSDDSDHSDSDHSDSDDSDSDDSDSGVKSKKKKSATKKSTASATKKEKKNPPTVQQSGKKRNTGGIRILRLTQDKAVLIKLILDAVKFESFKCTEPKIMIGIDVTQLHGMLKSINDSDPITLYMNRDNKSVLHIHSSSENNGHIEETDLEICLMEVGNQEMPLPRAEFQNKITMASDKFHTICKNLNNNSVHVEITSIDNEISFKGKSEGGKISRTYKDDISKKDKQNLVIQGNYELRNLMYFSKCNKLCPTIDIYLKNDFPLVLVISVATLGKMYIFLTPVDSDVNS